MNEELVLTPIEVEYSWDSNWYSNPEKYNLEVIQSVDLAGSYEFSMFVVAKDSDNNYWWASDSGCSCPTPFDSTWILRGLNDYHSWIEFREDVIQTAGSATDPDASIQAVEFLDKLEHILPGALWDRLRKLGRDGG